MSTELRALILYLVDLAILKDHLNLFYSYLSQDEMAKAKKFKQLHLEENYVLTRGLLRSFLAHYLNLPAQQLKFDYGDRGKPSLPDHSLQFNLSHSGHWSLFSFSPAWRIGVDLELIKPMEDVVNLAHRFFCEEETKFLSSIQDKFVQEKAFFTLWTAKEAYLKAIGTGLGGGLDSIQLTLDSQLQIRRWHQAQQNQNNDVDFSWSIHRLHLPPNLMGAIAINETDIPMPRVPLMTKRELEHFL